MKIDHFSLKLLHIFIGILQVFRLEFLKSRIFLNFELSAMRPAPQGTIPANSVTHKSARPSPQLSHPTFSAPNIQATSSIRHRLASSQGAGLTSDLRAKQSSIPVPSPQVAMETEKRGPVFGGGEKQNDKLSPLMTPQPPLSQLVSTFFWGVIHA